MPEGHKTHRLAHDHTQGFAGQRLRVSSPQGRFDRDAEEVTGSTLRTVEAVGKHLFYAFAGQRIIHVHLGRYGEFRHYPTPPPEPRGAVRMRLVGRTAVLDLHGPTQCRVITPATRRQVEARLGPDPLGGGDREVAWFNLQRSRVAIGAWLLDQSMIAGIGNIFRAEALFELGIDPNRPANQLTRSEFRRLWRVIVRMMKTGFRHGRIITVTAKEAGRPLAKLRDHERLRIYGASTCPRCDGKIETIKLGGRALYLCRRCQPATASDPATRERRPRPNPPEQ